MTAASILALLPEKFECSNGSDRRAKTMHLEKKYARILTPLSLVVVLILFEYLVMRLPGEVQNRFTSDSTIEGCRVCKPPGQGLSNISGLESLSFLALTWAALIDSINPCAISTLLFLSTVVLATGRSKKVLGVSLAFILSSYVTYLLVGLGIIVVVGASGLSLLFRRVVAILSIIVGFDQLSQGDRSLVEIPDSWKSKLATLLSGVTGVSAAFIAGSIVTLLELPCTGGPYMVVLGLLTKKTGEGLVSSVLLLLYYNFIFVLPLVIISLLFNWDSFMIYLVNKNLVTFGPRARFEQKNIWVLRLVTGLTMILMAMYLLLP